MDDTFLLWLFNNSIIYAVEVSSSSYVQELVEWVNNGKEFVLYKALESIPRKPNSEAIQRAEKTIALLPLERSRQLAEYFTDPDPNLLHIIVKAVSPIDQTPPIEPVSRIDNRLTQIAPSKLNSREMKSLQDNANERVLNDRPRWDQDDAPIKLLFSGFGVFHDIVSRKTLPNEFRDWIHDRVFFDALLDYRKAASLTYSSEDDKRDASIAHLNKLYSSLKSRGDRSIESSKVHGDSNTDGHTLDPHGIIYFIQGLKLELGSKGAVPETQVASYFTRSFNTPRAMRDVLQYARVPAVALIAFGSVVQFVGMIMLGKRLRMSPLWHPIDIRVMVGDDLSEDIVWLFKAAVILDGLLYRELKAIVQNTKSATQPLLTNPRFPVIDEASRCQDGIVLMATFKFELLQKLHANDTYRLLYFARDLDAHESGTSKFVIVKFVQSYSFELHTYLERKQRAPRLFGFQRLPGDWIVVVMEHLVGFSPLHFRVEDGMAFTDKLAADLSALVNEMHEQNLVHGDFRETNILLPRDDVKDALDRPFVVVDFDWGGRIGEAKFPSALLNPAIHVGDTHLRLIQPMDDVFTLMDMVERLRKPSM